jgi:hypothetical protein
MMDVFEKGIPILGFDVLKPGEIVYAMWFD